MKITYEDGEWQFFNDDGDPLGADVVNVRVTCHKKDDSPYVQLTLKVGEGDKLDLNLDGQLEIIEQCEHTIPPDIKKQFRDGGVGKSNEQ